MKIYNYKKDQHNAPQCGYHQPFYFRQNSSHINKFTTVLRKFLEYKNFCLYFKSFRININYEDI